MSNNGKEGELRLGFLTAIDVPELGYMGGLLVTNRQGRPLEFQCTTPIKPNRTQQILYGPTLVPFLLSDLIARTLVEKVGVKPDLILTEREEILALRPHVSVPVACVEAESGEPRHVAGQGVVSGGVVSGDVKDEGGRMKDEFRNPTDDARTVHPSSFILHPSADASPRTTHHSPLTTHPSPLPLGRQFLRFHAAHQSDRELVAKKTNLVPREADLCEPFERVREALQEALQLKERE